MEQELQNKSREMTEKKENNREVKFKENVIEIEHLKKYYGQIKAVDDISFCVKKGELFGFLGINGAGKSTTINMLCTLFAPTEGDARVCGYSVLKQPEEIRKRIGIVYQNNCLDDKLTVLENLMVRGSLYEASGKKVKENAERVIEELSLKEIIKRPFGKLSGGQKRKCEIARALMNTPEILFLDEPTTGLDPATRKSVWENMEVLRKERDMTVFLTTHYMEEAAKAKHIAILDKGKLKEYGTPFSLKESYAKDSLFILPKADKREDVILQLKKQNREVLKRENRLLLPLHGTLEAVAILQQLQGQIEGFEVMQGTLDDVFLNVTGKNLLDVEV